MTKILAFCSIVCALLLPNDAFLSRSIVRSTKYAPVMMSTEEEMDVGDFENAVFKRTAVVKDNVSKFSLEATIAKASLNSYLLEYKEEMKRRKVLFPGFRAGKLPPYVMPDVRKYLVCYGLETLIGQLCNGNGLKVIRIYSYYYLFN